MATRIYLKKRLKAVAKRQDARIAKARKLTALIAADEKRMNLLADMIRRTK